MYEMNCFEFKYSGSIQELEVEIQNLLINEIEELLRHNANVIITFKSLFLEGKISNDRIEIEQLEIIDSVGSCDRTKYITYTFSNNDVSVFTIAEIIVAFIHQYFA
jgi:hypothetical protein